MWGQLPSAVRRSEAPLSMEDATIRLCRIIPLFAAHTMQRLEYTLSKKDFLEAQRAHGRWASRFLPIFGGLLMLAGIFTLAQDPKHLGNALAGILIGAALAFGQRILLSYRYQQDKRLHDRFSATFSEEGIEVSASTGSSKHEWKAFTRYIETKGLFLLYQGPMCMNIFPKACFGSGEADAFRNLVQQKLGNKMDRKRLSPSAWIFILVVAVAFVLMLIVIRNAVRQSGPRSTPAQTQSTN